MFNRNHVFAIAAVAAFSILSLTACSDENSDITNVPDESELSSSSTPSVEPESSSSSERELSSSSVHSIVPKSSSSETEQSSSSAPSIESSSSSEKSSSSSEKSPDSDLIETDVKCNAIKPNPVDGDECSYKNDGGYLSEFVYVDGRWRKLSDVSTSDLLQMLLIVNCIKNWVRIIITVLGVNGSLPLWFLNNLRIPEKRA